MDLQKLCFEVQYLVAEAGKFIKSEKENFSISNHVEIKGHSNFVTYVDKESERLLVEGLANLLPEAGFIAEEGTSAKKGELFNWVIDPLDGTTNFIHGLPPHSISVALMRNSDIVIGVVFEICNGEMFYAWEGSLAYCNSKAIQVSNASAHNQALIATGFPYYNFEKFDAYIETLKFMMANTHGVRRLGSAAIDLCYVACGRFDAFWEYALHAWDVAAGVLILKQAGGVVCDFDGNENYLFGGEIIATNKNYFEQFYSEVNQFQGKKG